MPDFDIDAALATGDCSLGQYQLYGSDWGDGFTYIYVDIGPSFLFIGRLRGQEAQTPYNGAGVRQFDTRQDAVQYLLKLASQAHDNRWTDSIRHHRIVLPQDSYRI